MEGNNKPITKALTLLSSLRCEIVTMQSNTVSMETLIANLFKYFAVLRDEIVVPDVYSSGLQDQLEEISQSLRACKDLVLSFKSSGEVILRQADLVGESYLQAKGARQRHTAEHTFSDSGTGFESLDNSLTLDEVKYIIGGSDSDNNDNGSLDNLACSDVTVKNEEVFGKQPSEGLGNSNQSSEGLGNSNQSSEGLENQSSEGLGNQSSEGLGNQSSEGLGNQSSEGLGNQSSEGLGNQSLTVANETYNIPPQEVTNSENIVASLLLKCEHCDKICESELDLNSHLQSHSQDNNKDTLRCKECRKNFNSKQALTYHQLHSKAHTKKLKITEANMGSRTRASTGKPISETISGKSKLKPNKNKTQKSGYDECGKCFKTIKALDVHMVQKHKGGKNTCGPLNKAYRSKAGLQYYRKDSNAHTNEERQFLVSEELVSSDDTKEKLVSNHRAKVKLAALTKEKMDIIEKPYGCNVCGKGYKNRKGLQYHKKKTMHFKEWKSNDALNQNGDQECNDGSLQAKYHLSALNAHMKQVKTEDPKEKAIVVAENDSESAEESVTDDNTEDQSGSNNHTTGKYVSNVSYNHTTEDSVSNDNMKETSVSIAPTEEKLEIDIIEKTYGCNVCGKGYKSRCGLWKHRKIYKHFEEWKTDKKLTETPAQNGDQQSIDAMQGSQEPEDQLSCMKCGQKLKNAHNLRRHIKMGNCRRDKFAKSFICQQCGKKLSTKGGLRTHLQTFHRNPVLTMCEVCGVQVPRLKQHMTTHEEKRYKCPQCDKAFQTKSYFDRHLQNHQGIKPHMCEICGKAYTMKSGLEYHMAGHLNSKTAFKCDVCGKGFFHKGLLLSHNRVHSEAKFKCKTCGKCTRTKGTLRAHMVTHTGEKTHKCKICGEMFKHHTVLRRHVRKHMGLKPYLCPHCGKAFIDSWGLKQHTDRCMHGDRRRKDYRDSKTASSAALSPVSTIACTSQ